ncbi:SDR family oxidoreductase [Catenuloplanes japonicus]|uniref:SDR family oxidoreductase n=1 Tax=Catenuloplanes japonicus TaxID=33876 RepID=UPI000527A867|nr:SDR family oxidoreductase [Catenuloplanes japonicus]
MSRTVLVTGTSSGIGRATAELLATRGYRVFGTSRKPGGAEIPGVETLPLDLADPDSVETLAGTLATVDVLVNNAGESQSAPFEEVPGDWLRRLFETNVFGPVRLAQLALPGMRERGYGRIVMVGSMQTSFPVAYRSAYTASKAAITAFSNAARHEFSPFGVWLTTVDPGSIATGITERRTIHIAPDSPHRRDFDTMLAALNRDERAGTPPSRVATTILKAIESDRPHPRYAIGSRAPFLFTVRWLTPATLMEKIIHRRYNLNR